MSILKEAFMTTIKNHNKMNNQYNKIKHVILLGSLIFLLGSIIVPQASGQLMKTDPEGIALMAIYNATGGSNWANKTNWGSDTKPLDEWYGVTVSGGKLTRLHLGENRLEGVLPDVFDALSDLTFLHLKKNSLDGAVPASFGDLVNLEFLGLNYNSFDGPLPVEMKNMVSLVEVYVQWNNLSGEVPDFSGATNLSHLHLQENEFESFASPGVADLENLKIHLMHFMMLASL